MAGFWYKTILPGVNQLQEVFIEGWLYCAGKKLSGTDFFYCPGALCFKSLPLLVKILCGQNGRRQVCYTGYFGRRQI